MINNNQITAIVTLRHDPRVSSGGGVVSSMGTITTGKKEYIKVQLSTWSGGGEGLKLQRMQEGNTVMVMGSLSRSKWTDDEGITKKRFVITCTDLHKLS